MADKKIPARHIQKHDIEANWNKATNFVPKLAEIIVYDKDNIYDYPRFKIGDGVTKVNELSFCDDQNRLNQIFDTIYNISHSWLWESDCGMAFTKNPLPYTTVTVKAPATFYNGITVHYYLYDNEQQDDFYTVEVPFVYDSHEDKDIATFVMRELHANERFDGVSLRDTDNAFVDQEGDYDDIEVTYYVSSKLDNLVPMTRKINGKALTSDINITAEELGIMGTDVFVDWTGDNLETTIENMSTNIEGIQDQISTLTSAGLTREVVSALPATTAAKENVIYMVGPKTDNDNTYDEYMYIKSSNKFEMIGTTDIDLSNYATKDEIVQSDWNITDTSSKAFIKNKVPFKNDTTNGGTIFNEGAAAAYSLAGGSTDKSMITSIVGDLGAAATTVNAPKATGKMSLSLGANTESKAPGAMTFGFGNTAGIKGYYWWDINFSTKVIQLSTERQSLTTWTRKIPSNIDWAVGDWVSIVNGDKYPMCCKITAVDKTNGTITVDSLPFTSKESPTIKTPEDNGIYAIYENDQSSLTAKTKPRWSARNGVVDFGFGAWSQGINNYSAGMFSTTENYNNIAFGDYTHVEGRQNIGGNRAHVEGNENIGLGNNSHVGGFQNTVKFSASNAVVHGKNNTVSGNSAQVSGVGNTVTGYAANVSGENNTVGGKSNATFGEGNTNKHYHTLVAGQGLTSGKDNQTVLGSNNLVDNESMLVVSSDFAGGANVFTVNPLWDDGARPEDAYAHAEKPSDAITKGYLEAAGKSLMAECDEDRNNIKETYAKKNEIPVQTTNNIAIKDDNTIGSTAKYNLISGTDNNVDGSRNVIGGTNHNVTASTSLIGGHTNTVSSSHSVVGGYNNTVSGESAANFGNHNTNSNKRSLTVGRYLKTGSDDQIVGGKYNAPDADSYLVIGNGTSDTARKNAFTVNASGTPTKDTDAVTKKYADDKYLTKDEAADLGGGDMLKSVYDTNNNGIVDNAEKLGGVSASEIHSSLDLATIYTSVGGETITLTDVPHVEQLVSVQQSKPEYFVADGIIFEKGACENCGEFSANGNEMTITTNGSGCDLDPYYFVGDYVCKQTGKYYVKFSLVESPASYSTTVRWLYVNKNGKWITDEVDEETNCLIVDANEGDILTFGAEMAGENTDKETFTIAISFGQPPTDIIANGVFASSKQGVNFLDVASAKSSNTEWLSVEGTKDGVLSFQAYPDVYNNGTDPIQITFDTIICPKDGYYYFNGCNHYEENDCVNATAIIRNLTQGTEDSFNYLNDGAPFFEDSIRVYANKGDQIQVLIDFMTDDFGYEDESTLNLVVDNGENQLCEFIPIPQSKYYPFDINGQAQVPSISPQMVLWADTDGAVIVAKYKQNVKQYIDQARQDAIDDITSQIYDEIIIPPTAGHAETADSATSATTVRMNRSSSNNNYPVLFTSIGAGTAKADSVFAPTSDTVTMNPSTGTINATTFVGNLTGNATSASTLAIHDMSNKDLNTIKTAGWYYGYTNMTNAPGQMISVMEVIVYSPDWILQRLTMLGNLSSRPTYERTFTSATTWSDWRTVITSENISSQSVAKATTANSATYAVNDSLGNEIASTYKVKTISDTRNINSTPEWYFTNASRQITTEFKLTSVIGLAGNGSDYCVLTTTAPWSDSSGGQLTQEANINDRKFIRYSIDNSNWSDWEEILNTNSPIKTSGSIEVGNSLYITKDIIGTVPSGDTLGSYISVDSINNEPDLYYYTNHCIRLGKSGRDKVEVYEYGGEFNLYQSQSGNNTLIMGVSPTSFTYKGNNVATENYVNSASVASVNIKDITELPAGAGSYPITLSAAITLNGVTFPNYSKGMFVSSGASDATLYVIDTNGKMYTAFRNNGTWQNPKIMATTADVDSKIASAITTALNTPV